MYELVLDELFIPMETIKGSQTGKERVSSKEAESSKGELKIMNRGHWSKLGESGVKLSYKVVVVLH